MRRFIPWLLGMTLVLAACSQESLETAALETSAAPAATCARRSNNTIDKLLPCVTLDGVRTHQAALQAIADANGGTREAGTAGYDASAAYVADALTAAGFAVTIDPFEITYVPTPTLQQLTPINATYATGAFTGSGSGSVTGEVAPVDLALVPPRLSTSGCEAADFAGFPAGAIALIQRGTCNFDVKALNAEAAGAAAVIIFNQGNTPDREGLIVGTLGASVVGIPVVGASFADGVALAEPGSTAAITVPASETRTTVNVLAELPGKVRDNVVMAGAHLDSVRAGPGIQDNGSGSTALLETALQMARVKPRNTVRFAWWGAEEAGLVGSTAWVNDRTPAELQEIALYLNFDMIASPNHVFFVYDGDDSDGVGAPAGPEGSGAIETFFESFYAARGLPFKGTDFSGRSDYGPFVAVGIPAGGLFTGAEGIKTPEEAATWGGTAGDAYDPCYHLACDTFDNVNLFALDVNADAVAASVLTYGMNTFDVNGERGRGNFKVPNRDFLPAD